LLLANFLSRKQNSWISSRLDSVVLWCFLSAVCTSAFHLVFLAECF